jgi:hypothetical protein
MKNPWYRAWFMLTITPAVIALLLRLGYETTIAVAPGTWVILILLILAVLGLYAFLFYFAINPDIKKLQTPLFRIGVALIATAGVISTIIHYYRFVPSPEANMYFSVPMATLLLISAISGYALVMYILWKTWKRKPD